MQPYCQLNSHCIGKSHLAGSKPCEDYSLSYGDPSLSAAMISDGHGDPACFRSAAGAQFACEISLNLLRQFQGVHSHITDVHACDFESYVRSLEKEIAVRWKKKVLSDASARPFTEEELDQAPEAIRSQYRQGQSMEHAYGCTLVAVMVSRHYFLCLQIGDGKCVSAYPCGVFVEPVPPDEGCVGNRSTSLCNRDAEKSFRHYYSPLLPLAAFVSSDGVEESFDAEGLYRFFYSVAYWHRQEGADSAAEKLAALLPRISEGGSGDDVSVAAVLSSEETLSPPKQPLTQVCQRVNAVAGRLEMLDGQIQREDEMIQERIRDIESEEAALAALKEQLKEREERYYAACEECDGMKARLAELREQRAAAAVQKSKADAFRQSAEKFWFAEYARLGIGGFSQSEGESVPSPPAEPPVKTVFAAEDLPSDEAEQEV